MPPKADSEENPNSGYVVLTLLLFMALMGIAPIAAYYLTVDAYWEGNTWYAVGTSVAVGYIIVMLYVAVALWEDSKYPLKRKPLIPPPAPKGATAAAASSSAGASSGQVPASKTEGKKAQ